MNPTRRAKRPEKALGGILRKTGLTLAVAESCTGGLFSKIITDAPGSSDYFLGSVVAYDNSAKTKFTGIGRGLIKRHGAVSIKTAEALALGIRRRLDSDIGVSITGIAGPTGGSVDKPVGTVCIGISFKGKKKVLAKKYLFKGKRAGIRRAASLTALRALIKALHGG
ncbi:MAG: nicotinamide-nucleotide amidohydrolase family protein [Deltaproteobacteria bacterium]